MANDINVIVDTTAPEAPVIDIDGAGVIYTANQAGFLDLQVDADTAEILIFGDVDPAADANIQLTQDASKIIPAVNQVPITLSAGDGKKVINVISYDKVGNYSSAIAAEIYLVTKLATITVADQNAAVISLQPGDDAVSFDFTADVDIAAWTVAIVGDENATFDQAIVIPNTYGSVVSGTAVIAGVVANVAVRTEDIEAANAGDGNKIIKVFAQNMAGTWSV